MTETLLALPSHLRRRLVDALASGMLSDAASATSIRATLGLTEGGETIARALRDLAELGITGPATAAWIRSLDQAVARMPRPDLVWSGPELLGVHARDTRRVYELSLIHI